MTRKIKLPDYPCVALVLQGGGALGSYQAGVYEGLAEAGIHPNWVAGISIGSLNCAIIAGNPPEKRVEQLHGFWDAICTQPTPSAFLPNQNDFVKQLMAPWNEMMANLGHSMASPLSAMSTMMKGQEHFFKPRPMGPGKGSPELASFYDTSPLLETLERFADFDRINNGDMRVSLGATNVASGNFVYFDSTTTTLTPKHFLASGSLPPGFPATEIDGEYYWDGGCVSNTPLEHVLGMKPHKDTLVFQVDLWSAKGQLPIDVLQVTERLKDIQYSSRTRSMTSAINMTQKMRKIFFDTVDRIPASVRAKDPWFDQMKQHMLGARYNVIHLIYQNKGSEGHYKDYEFSSETKQMHWQTGLHDMHETLEQRSCLEMPAEGENFVTFDVHTHRRSSSSDLSPSTVKESPTAPVKKAVRKSPAVKASSNRKPLRRAPE